VSPLLSAATLEGLTFAARDPILDSTQRFGGFARFLREPLMSGISRRAVLGWSLLGVLAPFAVARAAGEMPTASERVALQGYDPVAYFTDGRPEKGSAEFSASFDGTTYWFKNAEHKALFVADPDHYAPRFNGYCAAMVSRGIKYEADPETWAIADGKLWVFGGKKGEAVYLERPGDVLAKAAENWPEVRQKPVTPKIVR
jgi:YHS domain-containing protein